MANSKTSPKVEKLLIDLAMISELFFELFHSKVHSECVAIDNHEVEDELILSECSGLIAEQIIDQSKVLNELKIFDTASLDLSCL